MTPIYIASYSNYDEFCILGGCKFLGRVSGRFEDGRREDLEGVGHKAMTPEERRQRIEELKRLCEAATAGPWYEEDTEDEDASGLIIAAGRHLPIAALPYPESVNLPDNAAFIVAAREALPWALAELERLEEENQRLIAAEKQWNEITNTCWTCGGDPKVQDCICGGSGKHADEVQNMREQCLGLAPPPAIEKARAEERERCAKIADAFKDGVSPIDLTERNAGPEISAALIAAATVIARRIRGEEVPS